MNLRTGSKGVMICSTYIYHATPTTKMSEDGIYGLLAVEAKAEKGLFSQLMASE